MKKCVFVVILMVLIPFCAAFANSWNEDLTALKGSKVEILYTEYNKTETGVIVNFYTVMGNIIGMQLQTPDNAVVYIGIGSVKSIKLLPPKK